MRKTFLARPLPDDPVIAQWLQTHEQSAAARACVYYSLAYNLLDIGWVKNMLAPGVHYCTQGSVEGYEGVKRVTEFLSGKFDTLRSSPEHQPLFELAETGPDFQPCASGCQPLGAFDRNWLSRPVVSVAFETGPLGLISKIFNITSMPNPAYVRRRGIYPGTNGTVKERPRLFIRPTQDFQGVRLDFYVWSGKYRQDQQMLQTADAVQEQLPGAEVRVVILHEIEPNSEAKLTLRQAQLTVFPSVVVYYRGEGVFRYLGVISAHLLIDAIVKASPLHVVSDS
ncbi:hypothetical protein [Ottowia thiooxydans]|uniref:hypothetical protein n=1 Tax=Ottowia thiooxydans TaxID=219182 RepID=UPI00041559BB|nr:hypothetical protein [Ottowia thiooxydans]